MPAWLEWIVYILIVIVMLGVLIAIHELGHLATAKMFKVYCFEYSIGMGPKLFSKKRKNGETAFSLRAIPFGGFVAMYGEPGSVPDGMEEPDPSRSLESIAKWKKAIILLAGVTLNFILGLVLIYIGDSACPMFYSGRTGARSAEGTTLTVTLDTSYDEGVLGYLESKVPVGAPYTARDYVLTLPLYETKNPSGQTETIEILAGEVRMYANPETPDPINADIYVAAYVPSTLIDRHGLGDSLYLFPASQESVPTSLTELGVKHLPQVYNEKGELNTFNFSNSADGVSIGMDLSFIPSRYARTIEDYPAHRVQADGKDPLFRCSVSSGRLQGLGVTVEPIKYWNSFQESWQRWAVDVPNACTGVVRGFASLFTPNGWKNVSGIIGITAAMPQVNAAGGARMVFFYAGLISINLAFFNLLPFPGLDGWQLLVTVIEGVSRKKVPQKVQGIVSTVGLVLLFGLMIFIAVKDVASLIH